LPTFGKDPVNHTLNMMIWTEQVWYVTRYRNKINIIIIIDIIIVTTVFLIIIFITFNVFVFIDIIIIVIIIITTIIMIIIFVVQALSTINKQDNKLYGCCKTL